MRPLPWLAAAFLVSCAVPPPDAYVAGSARSSHVSGVDLGQNAAQESCVQQERGEGSADIYCGTWTQPSGRVRNGGRAEPATLRSLATTGPWRAEIDSRYACADPVSGTILGTAPALTMQCTRRIGGWPHVALVASVGGTAWLADGVQPAAPALERSIGVMSGRVQAAAAAHTAASDSLLASRLAGQNFKAGDVGAYEQLMAAGASANETEDFSAAEEAYRKALLIQQKLGTDNSGAALPTALLALQVASQGRVSEADGLLARADALAASSGDPEITAPLLFTRAQMAERRDLHAEALGLLRRAEVNYSAQLPPEVLNARPRPVRGNIVAISQRASTAGSTDLLGRDLLTDTRTRNAVLGLVETRRNEAIVLRRMGRLPEATAKLQAAQTLAAGNNLRVAVLQARLDRTAGELAADDHHADAASAGFASAATSFSTALPQSRPLAETRLLLAGQLADRQDTQGALAACQAATTLLRQEKLGTKPELLQPCLEVLATAAGQADAATRQALLAQMFETSQLAQGGVTSQQIASATARLGENARDPRVGDAIRAREAAREALEALYRRRDAAIQAGDSNTPPDPALDAAIARATAAVQDSETALQAASPNFGQLVQEVAPAQAVLAALAPGEAFAAIDLAPDSGFTFLLRDGRIDVARVPGGSVAMAELVKKVRASIEADPLPAFDTASAQQIYTAVFGGVAARLDGISALVVAPTGPLLSLPFGVLLTGPADAHSLTGAPWLLRRAAVAHVPAAANFVSLRRIAGNSRATRPWFGFGDFHPVTRAQADRSFPPATCGDSAELFAGLPPLPFARRELAAAQALTGASPADQLLGSAFTASAVLKQPLKDVRILHFATHALLPTDLHCQSEPAIVTSAPAGSKDAAGALLTAAAVRDMDLDADAVILSACNSGGPAGGAAGESLSGLARSFFYAGARALVVTHWSVNDQAAAILVALTLKRVHDRGDEGVAGAMRDAQLALLDGAGKSFPAEIAHPFYWAPFALIGEGGASGGAGSRHVAAAATVSTGL